MKFPIGIALKIQTSSVLFFQNYDDYSLSVSKRQIRLKLTHNLVYTLFQETFNMLFLMFLFIITLAFVFICRTTMTSTMNTSYFYHSTSPFMVSTTQATNQTTSDKTVMIMAYIYFNLTAITSVLSIIGCCIVISTYIFYPVLRTSGRLLLVYLSIADLLTAVGNLMGITWYVIHDTLNSQQDSILCQTHSALTIFSSIASFFWTIVIAVHLYICIVMCDSNKADRLKWPFHMMSWGVPGKYILLA